MLTRGTARVRKEPSDFILNRALLPARSATRFSRSGCVLGFERALDSPKPCHVQRYSPPRLPPRTTGREAPPRLPPRTVRGSDGLCGRLTQWADLKLAKFP